MNAKRGSAVVLGLLAITGCDALEGTGYIDDRDPRNLEGTYAWVLQEWTDGRSVGYPMVTLTWELPLIYDEEAFRVYAREADRGGYDLIATVTSCIDGICRYDDINVAGGESYDYYVATVEEWDGDEIGMSETETVDVPTVSGVTAPGTPTAVSLDGAAFLSWTGTGAQRYMVLGQPEGDDIFLIGETDGTSYLDDRAENGKRYRYFLAAVDEFDHVSSLSPSADAFPRPDFHAEIIYADADQPNASGFHFVSSESTDPIVSGAAANAQWRLEVSGGGLVIRPLGQTSVTSGTFTTQLTCGPGSESNCVDVRVAPSASQFGSTPVPVEAGFTYVFRVIGDDNRTHYAKVRVQGDAVDTQNRRLVVFDWAYQVRADETNLDRIRDSGFGIQGD